MYAFLYVTQEAQNGSIGIALWHRWFEPLTDSDADVAAAQRSSEFLLGWYVVRFCIFILLLFYLCNQLLKLL